MSVENLDLLTWVFPTLELYRYFLSEDNKENKLPESDKSLFARQIIERVLYREYSEKGEHSSKIQKMLVNTTDQEKTIKALVKRQFAIVEAPKSGPVAYVTSSFKDFEKYSIAIRSDLSEDELPWIIAHEVSHALNEDSLSLLLISTISSIAMTSITTIAFHWSLIGSGVLGILASSISYIAYSQFAERAADDFANRCSSDKELEGAITFLERIKQQRKNDSFVNNIRRMITHPSADSRIAKIREELSKRASLEKRKVIA